MMEGLSIIKVSVVVPCHNEEDTIERCLNSLYATEIPSGVAMEVIVVNDRSTDRSLEIIKKFPVKLINKYKSETNPYAETLNLGIKYGTGDFMAIVDADIEVEKKWLVKLLPHFKNEKLGTASGFIVASPHKSWINTLYYLIQRRKFLRQLKGKGIEEEIFPVSGFYIFRRDVFENVGFFDGSAGWATDIIFNLKIRLHGYSQIADNSAIAHDLRVYTSRKFVQTCIRRGTGIYQTGGSLLYLHQELLFRYVFLAPYYCISLYKVGKSLISLLFPVYALTRYFGSITGYAMAALKKEEKCPPYLRQERRENEIKWMLNSFRRGIRRFARLFRL